MANATEAKFGDPVTRIAQTDCWTVLLRPKQPTFGSLVLVCREPVQAFAQASPQDFAELRGIVGKVESALRGFVSAWSGRGGRLRAEGESRPRRPPPGPTPPKRNSAIR